MSDPDRPVSSLAQDDADAQDEVEGLHVDRMTSPLAFRRRGRESLEVRVQRDSPLRRAGG